LKPYKCTELKEDGVTPCDYSASTKYKLQAHIDAVHRKLKPYKCTEFKEDGVTPCDYSAPTNQVLQRHIRDVHYQLKPYKCTEFKDDGVTPCDYSARNKQALQLHINAVHRKLKPYKCTELKEDGVTPCGLEFPQKSGLEKHIREVHLKIKPYKCTEFKEDGVTPCGQEFSTRSNFERHINAVHRQLKPYKCTEFNEDGTLCKYSFASNSDLQRHINAVHRQLKPYKCTEFNEDGTLCKYSFALNSNLQRHIREVHRRFHCTKCGKPFKQESDRDRHEMSCRGLSYETIKAKYHVKKGTSVEDVITTIIEQHCEPLNIPTTRRKVLGSKEVDLYCEGLEGKRIAIDITTAVTKQLITEKWTKRRYHDYPDVDELWVVVCSNTWDPKRCADLTNEVQRDSQYENVYIYHWTDLRNVKMMTIPPKIGKLFEVYEMCNLENKEECKKYWEEAKERFHTF
jgi:KRAB domain-containing zinc finger protein